MIYTGLLSLLLAEYAANQKCSAVLLCSADSVYPAEVLLRTVRLPAARTYLAMAEKTINTTCYKAPIVVAAHIVREAGSSLCNSRVSVHLSLCFIPSD